ncbi:MAG TPA: hypothetical protein OQH54_01045 [Nitrosopumilus sp.]|nr:hypothetical protein [Thermoproteota archaeon]HJJ22292.1 hypothetical protein [Nitrosopumilus sp.]
MEFRCIEECSQCCIEREYYPSKKFGKIGVLILPEEKERIEKLAKVNGLKIKILPRIGTSEDKNLIPTKILAYQLMGIERNGNTCPFLDTDSGNKSPHGGFHFQTLFPVFSCIQQLTYTIKLIGYVLIFLEVQLDLETEYEQ